MDSQPIKIQEKIEKNEEFEQFLKSAYSRAAILDAILNN